jgi:UDP-N-acetylglucosamine 2-epimerase (non-hydrolysing)
MIKRPDGSPRFGADAIVHIVGARPNFMKVAPVVAALASRLGVAQIIVHTGQHYDANMSAVFFRDLGLPEPDVNLEVGSASHAVQTAEVMVRFERFVVEHRPKLVLVYGDVNSTMAAALVCAKLGIPVGHVEAGLRSFDRTMPEEINRLVTDQIADWLFTPSRDADENLQREGVAPEKVHRVGNVMIDTVARLLPAARRRWDDEWRASCPERFGVVTLHRPSNVDDFGVMANILRALVDVSRCLPLFFPVHPRTAARIAESGLLDTLNGLRLLEPLSYLDFLALQQSAILLITDSGGIQEESTYLGVPCLTLRSNTERPVTVELGTNILVGNDMDRLRAEVTRVVAGSGKRGRIPPLWDGHAAERIASMLAAV